MTYAAFTRGAPGPFRLTDWTCTPASPITATIEVTEAKFANLLAPRGTKRLKSAER